MLITALLFCNPSIRAEDLEIIPTASYVFCHDTTCESTHGMQKPRIGKATFYTFDGNPIKTVLYENPELLTKQLDPEAPAPQLASCKIKYVPPVVGTVKNKFPIPKGVGGDFIIFYDKNNNPLVMCRFLEEYLEDPELYTLNLLSLSKLQDYNITHNAQIDALYQALRTAFKHQVYAQEEPLKTHEEHRLFIEPYLEKAESSLKSIQWCMRHPHLRLVHDKPESLLSKKYFDCLEQYVYMTFQEYLVPDKSNKRMVDVGNEKLLAVLMEVHAHNPEQDFNVIEEWSRIKALVTEMNKSYYKSLSGGKKIKLFFSKHID